MVFPAWLAVIEQVPAVTIVTIEPDTVQTGVVVEAKLTVSPEEAVAVSAKGAAPKVTPEGAAKVMVCEPGVTVKPCVTGTAAV